MSQYNLVDLTSLVNTRLIDNQFNTTTKVGLILDISAFRENDYKQDAIQKLTNSVFAIACKIYNQFKLNVWSFTSSQNLHLSVTPENYENYIQEQIIGNNKVKKWGGSDCLGAIESAISFYRPLEVEDTIFTSLLSKMGLAEVKKEKKPVLLVVLCDGENLDIVKALKILQDINQKNIFVHFIGIGNGSFYSLTHLSEKSLNVSFSKIENEENKNIENILSKKFFNWSIK